MAEMNELLSSVYRLKEGEETLFQNCVAVLDTEGQVMLPSGPGVSLVAGVLRESTLEGGQSGMFQVCGIAKIRIAEAVTVGDMLVIADTLGRVKPKTKRNVTIVGRAISSCIDKDGIIKCILTIPVEG